MDILAHSLWAGMGTYAMSTQPEIKGKLVFVAAIMAAIPDVVHVIPVLISTIIHGAPMQLFAYIMASPDSEPQLPDWVNLASHHLHCIFHSGIVALFLTAFYQLYGHVIRTALAAWWSHILIDVFTHSADFYPSPVLYPITYQGFDGLAWNTPVFMTVNYLALAMFFIWLVNRKKSHPPWKD